MPKILIKNGRIWNGEKFFFGDVLVDGKQVVSIEESINRTNCFIDYVYDASGKIVSPGLVDTHVHIRGTASDNIGIQAEMCSLPFGVTALNDAGSVYGDKGYLDSLGVRNTVFVASSIKDNHADFSHTQQLLDKYGDKAIGIKVYFDTTISDISDITALKEICDYATQRNLMVMVHCSESPTSMLQIVETLSTGDILTHAFHGGKNSCLNNNFEAFKLAQKKGVVIDAGFAGYIHTDFKNLEKSIKAGFSPNTISTDITCFSAYKRGGRYGMTMCMSIAKHLGMSEDDIFRSVTSAPAKALHKETEWGNIKVGAIADIAVFDYTDEAFDMTDEAGNHVSSSAGYRCMLTVYNGQVVYKH